MGTGEVASAALAAGYKTTSKHFRTIVSQTLAKGAFKRRRGKWFVKKQSTGK